MTEISRPQPICPETREVNVGFIAEVQESVLYILRCHHKKLNSSKNYLISIKGQQNSHSSITVIIAQIIQCLYGFYTSRSCSPDSFTIWTFFGTSILIGTLIATRPIIGTSFARFSTTWIIINTSFCS